MRTEAMHILSMDICGYMCSLFFSSEIHLNMRPVQVYFFFFFVNTSSGLRRVVAAVCHYEPVNEGV